MTRKRILVRGKNDPFFIEAKDVEERNSQLLSLGIREQAFGFFNDQKKRFEIVDHRTPDGRAGWMVYPISAEDKRAFHQRGTDPNVISRRLG